ncbi:alpha/beta fold hydrolase [bacterium]|nr:alpha/beta fold hydrolase [bacterium]
MKTLVNYFLFILILISSNHTLAQHKLQLVNIGDFKTNNGNIIKNCNIGYRTVGKLNSDSSNIILWPTWFDGTSENIVKPYNLPKWIDSTEFYIIVVDALADGISSSPSNTADFPEVTIRDMVNSQHELLVNHLNIDHIYAAFGISMGGMQVFEWMVAYPDFMDKVIPIIGTPKQSSFDIFVWQTQADIINEAGTDEEDINMALRRAYDVCNMNCYTPSNYVRTVEPEEMNNWRNKSYTKMRNSKDYLAQVNAMITHDIYKSASVSLDDITNIVKANILIIVSIQDHLVNPESSITLSKQLNCKLLELTGDCGHIAVWCEANKIKDAVSLFLK